LSRVANFQWVDERIRTQRIAPRTAAALPSAKEITVELIGTRAEVRRRGGIIPSWVLFGMIVLAGTGLCVTVNIRTHTQKQVASDQYQSLQSAVGSLQQGNEVLRTELQRLQTDTRAIESAARSQLNMARPNEIVVPVE
jgi:cell division protein FtsB